MTPPDALRRIERPAPGWSPARRNAALVLSGATFAAALIDPTAVATLLALLAVAALIAGALVARSLWRTWSRPIGTLSVGDAVLGAMVLRWWRRRQGRRRADRGGWTDPSPWSSPTISPAPSGVPAPSGGPNRSPARHRRSAPDSHFRPRHPLR